MAVLEDKGFIVAFSGENALIWSKDGNISSTIVIGVREGNLYKVSGHVVQSELWHKMMVTSNEKEDDPCQNSEIKREPTVLFNPQQNGIA